MNTFDTLIAKFDGVSNDLISGKMDSSRGAAIASTGKVIVGLMNAEISYTKVGMLTDQARPSWQARVAQAST